MNSIVVTVLQIANTYTSIIKSPNIEPLPHRKVLVIQCHPSKTSFSSAMADAVCKGLHKAGHEIKLKRLYCYEDGENYDNFTPQLSSAEFSTYHDNQQLVERQHYDLNNVRNMSLHVKEAINDLRWCNSIVFVYPTWWFNFPATLKGYFDKILLPGVAFALPKQNQSLFLPQNGLIPLLTHITKVGAVTSYGASNLAVFYCGDNSRRFLSRGFRPLLAPNCQISWHGLYSIHTSSKNEREAYLKEIEKDYEKF
eukprot:gene9587-12913_t